MQVMESADANEKTTNTFLGGFVNSPLNHVKWAVSYTSKMFKTLAPGARNW